jgi:hypothetical protein
MQDFEKLGVFYLGREYDIAAGKPADDMILYDARDLVTHAVCVGMTGSGKTGLCIDLIEEAAIDNIPAILIDPKGDLPNLLLTFPELRGEDFLPWINQDDAVRKGLSPEEYAEQQAELWTKGLAGWGQDGQRIARLRDAAEFLVYTPGSSAGLPVSILKSFAAPTTQIIEEPELLQERISTTVTSLLGLIGIQADPLQSREHILISTIIGQLWQQGQDVDLATLIQQVQEPPVTRIGVLDLESFYPAKERFSLVLALNNLLASPGFQVWLEGQPLDIDRILYTPSGKPRVAIFSIAHLSDPERMFFVSILLNQILGWMRAQPGTTSLRALIYMDEIYGYLPPVANPPSKQPMLTLLKQARAYGLGIVLATQNPVDLDYKGLSNTGTWFIGRLQTERDKARVMEGLEGVAAAAGTAFDRNQLDKLLAGLDSRVFLMNNTHEDGPVVFHTRWAMSYLRGPLTRTQIRQLMDPYKTARPRVVAAPAGAPVPAVTPAPGPTTIAPVAPVVAPSPAPALATTSRPSLPPDVAQFFVPVRGPAAGVIYRPRLIGAARLNFSNARIGVDITRAVSYLTAITDEAVPVNWEDSERTDILPDDLERTPEPEAQFAELPPAGSKATNYATWSRRFATWLYASQRVELLRSPSTKLLSEPGERERDFRIRLQIAAREERDRAAEKLRSKYASKTASLKEKIRRAEQAVDREQDQARAAGMQTAISVGATLLSAFTGRKSLGRATTAARGASRSLQQQSDVDRAKETLKALQDQLAELDAQFQSEIEALESQIDAQTEALDPVVIRPKKAEIVVLLVALVWAPYRQAPDGLPEPAW